MKKKIIALVLCMVLLVAASVTATMAYLTAEDSVTNTFTVGSISMTIDETNVDKLDKDGKDNSDQLRDDYNTYKLMPGSTIPKDPQVHVTANSDCYVFIHVENGLSGIEAPAETGVYTQVADQITAASPAGNGWTPAPVDGKTGYYYKIVSASANEQTFNVFQNFKVKSTVDNTTLARYAQQTIVVKAFAIQKDNLSLTQAIGQFPTDF